MANPSPTLSRKTEMAAVAYLKTIDVTGIQNGDGSVFDNFVCGKASTTKKAPLVTAYAEKAEFDDNRSGNGHVTLHIEVKFPMAVNTDNVNPVVQSDLLTSTVFNAFRLGEPGDSEATANAINGIAKPIADYTAMTTLVISEESGQQEGEGQVWTERLTLDVYAGQVAGM